MLRINLISVDNSGGLSRDLSVMYSALVRAGAHVRIFSPHYPVEAPADLNIFLELISPAFLPQAHLNVAVPNPECWPGYWNGLAGRVMVLAKTHETERIFSALGFAVVYVGFHAEDRYMEEPRVREFLHLPGNNNNRSTTLVLEAWQRHPEWPQITVVKHSLPAPRQAGQNVQCITDYLSDADLRLLQNRCLFHVCPSRTEGFGHYIDEARSCGAVVLTTNAPPMTELVSATDGMLIATTSEESWNEGVLHDVSADAIETTVTQALALPDPLALGTRSRVRYLAEAQAFRERIDAWLKELVCK